MAITLKNIILGLVGKTLNIPNERLTELLNEADENLTDVEVIKELLDADKARVKTLQTKSFDDGHKKAMGKALSDFEDEIRTEFNISDTSLKGTDLIKSVVQTQNKQEGNNSPLTEDAVKKHPLYIKLQDESKAAVKKVTDEYIGKLAEVETGFKRKETLADFRSEARKLFKALNPVLPEDAALAENQENLFLNNILSGNNYEKQGDRWVILDADGKVKQDEHGNAIVPGDYVKNAASQIFAFHKTGVGGNSGNRNDGKSNPAGAITFKNEDAFMTYMEDRTKTLEERTKASEAWEAQTKTADAAE